MKKGVLQFILQFCLTKRFPSFCYIPSLFSSFILEHCGSISPYLLKKVFMQVHLLFWIFTFSYFPEGCPVPSFTDQLQLFFQSSEFLMFHHLPSCVTTCSLPGSLGTRVWLRSVWWSLRTLVLHLLICRCFLLDNTWILNLLELNSMKHFKALRSGKGGRNELPDLCHLCDSWAQRIKSGWKSCLLPWHPNADTATEIIFQGRH